VPYLSPLLAAFVGILHASLAPVVLVGGVKPNLVLVAVVLVTILVGFLPGISWAFVAGVTANLLVGDPLGSVPLALLAAAIVVAAGAPVLGRLTWVYPVIAAFVGSIVADAASIAIGLLVADASVVAVPGALVAGAALLNAAIVAVVIYPARAVVARYATDEASAW